MPAGAATLCLNRRERRMFRLLAVLSLVFAAAALLPTAAAANTVVVDDDNAQCADADVATIQKAVDKAAKKNSDSAPGNDVDLIRVCPGLYFEQVSVPEQVSLPESLVVTIRGEVDTVKAAVADCFASTLTPDPETQAIVAPPAAPAHVPTKIFELQADNIELQGFVLRGQTGPPRSAAVTTDAGHSGYRVHGNLIMGNTVAAFFRSSGALASSFDNNCLRENGWGVANHWLRLVNAQIHHNSTFRTANFAYEQTSYCPELLETGSDATCLPSRIAMDGWRSSTTSRSKTPFLSD